MTRLFAPLALLLAACIIPVQPANQQPTSPPATEGTYGDGSDPRYAGGATDPNAGSDPNAGYGASEPASGGAAPAPQGPVSVNLVNRCSDTVPVFFGTKPKYGSGTQSSLSGNSRSSKSMMPGEMIWLTDASGNGLSSVTISAATREVETDCGSISAR